MSGISLSEAQKKMVSVSLCQLCGRAFYRKDLHSGPPICNSPQCVERKYSAPKTVNLRKDILSKKDIELILNNKVKTILKGPFYSPET